MNIASVLWQKNPALAWREIDEATVIISPIDSVMHELNDTGSFLWKNIDGHKSAADLAVLLAENYEVTPDIALTDTQSLLEEMCSRKLLVPVPVTGGESR
jgi:coenzyme PQQ synthesis protein D (PqqD)